MLYYATGAPALRNKKKGRRIKLLRYPRGPSAVPHRALFSQQFYTRRENIRTQLIDFRLSGPGIHAAAAATEKYTKNLTVKDKTYLSSMEDVQKYGKNTDIKHGARHFCGRTAYRARLATVDVCVSCQKPAY